MTTYIGIATPRVDGRAKVTGAAKYAGEFNTTGLAHASLVTSTIAKGRIARIDATEALSVAGVIDVLTHQNRPPMASADSAYKDETAPDGSPYRPLYDGRIRFSGQPIALVVAEEPEIARFAASLVRVEYVEEAHVTEVYRQREKAVALEPGANPFGPPKWRGQPERALATAAVRHQGEYFVPIEHHNPMELYASTVIFEPDGKLTIYDKTQGVQNVQRYLCGVLEMEPGEVRVLSPFVGGAFGSGLRPQFQVVLAALAARALKRSVRLVLTRQQMYGLGFRPAMIQRIGLGAKAGGTLDAITHDALTITSQYEDFHRQETGWSGLLYECRNADIRARARAPRSCDAVRHARSQRGDRGLCARMRDGRTRGRAEARSARASPALLFGARPEQWPAL
jgi:xanthine dehydrogenase YagR molybdenum-binding subunit